MSLISDLLPSRNKVSQDSNHDRWSDEAPAKSPVKSGLLTQHELNVIAKSINAVNPAEQKQSD